MKQVFVVERTQQLLVYADSIVDAFRIAETEAGSCDWVSSGMVSSVVGKGFAEDHAEVILEDGSMELFGVLAK